MKMYYVKKNGKADKEFFYNILIPDFFIYVIGIFVGFASLLVLFS